MCEEVIKNISNIKQTFISLFNQLCLGLYKIFCYLPCVLINLPGTIYPPPPKNEDM